MILQPHQQRVVDEKRDLDVKRTALGAFFNTQIFSSLPEDERERMHRQADAMDAYSIALGDRINAF